MAQGRSDPSYKHVVDVVCEGKARFLWENLNICAPSDLGESARLGSNVHSFESWSIIGPIRSMLVNFSSVPINRTIFHGVYRVIGGDGADGSLKCT